MLQFSPAMSYASMFAAQKGVQGYPYTIQTGEKAGQQVLIPYGNAMKAFNGAKNDGAKQDRLALQFGKPIAATPIKNKKQR